MARRLPSFWIKATLAALLVAAADLLLFEYSPGVNLAVFGLACVAALALANLRAVLAGEPPPTPVA